jgi:hypothetical protein
MASGRSRWNFVGGGNAHAMTLHVLGYRCVGQSKSGFKMLRDGIEIIVPKEQRLTDEVVNYIRCRCGHSRDEYLVAWQTKRLQRPKLNCP